MSELLDARRKGWLSLGIRVALSLGLLYCIYLVSTRAIALWYFRQPPPEGIRKAIEWDPKNPEYYAALARYHYQSLEEVDMEETIRLFEKATRLSPHRARYWTELGDAYALAGRIRDAERAYERAQRFFPNSPRINWQRANFHLRAGEVAAALPALQKAIIGDPELRLPAFDLAWRAGADPGQILQVMLPPDSGIYFQYIHYLIRTERLDQAGTVWARLIDLGLRFEPKAAFPYLDALIRDQRVDEVTGAWATLAQRHPTLIRQRRFESNLITNGDFESKILNGGLGWRVQSVEGVVVRIDSLNFFDGSHSLQIWFDGQHNVNYHHILQYVPVKPNTLYRFVGHMRARGITTDSGPRFELYDAYDGKKLFLSTQNRVGTSSWLPERLEFRTGPDTHLLVIQVARPPSRKFDNQIAGAARIDSVSLNALE